MIQGFPNVYRKLAPAIAGAALLSVSAYFLIASPAIPEVPLFRTSAWQMDVLQYGDQIFLRRDKQGGALLISHNKYETVYRYDLENKTVTTISQQAWRDATGPISECAKQLRSSSKTLTIDIPSHRLFAGDREVATAGRNVLKLVISPSGRWAAIVSSSGGSKPGLIPFLDGSEGSGDYYHQIVSIPEATIVGSPVRLPEVRGSDILTACWSEDERVIAYHDVLFSYFAVVETKLPSSLNPQ